MTLVKSPAAIVEDAELSGYPGLLARAPNWPRRPLGEFCSVQNGAPFKSSYFNKDGEGKPLIRIRDVGANSPTTYFSGEYDDAFLVRQGDLLVGMDGDFRVARWQGPEALLNQRVCRLIPDQEVFLPKLLERILQGYLDAIWNETSSITVKHLSSRSISEIPLPMPVIEEQRWIVEGLEKQFAHLGTALESTRLVNEKAAEFRRSLLHAAFTGALTGRRVGSGGIPEGWEIFNLYELVDILDSERKPVNQNERAKRPGQVPYYGASGQVGTIDKALFDEELVLLGEDGVQFFDPYKQKAYKIQGPAWVNNHAHVLRSHKDAYLPSLLVAFLNQFDYRGRATGTTRLKLTQAAMREIPVLTPPFEEQKVIVEILKEQFTRLEASLGIAYGIEKHALVFRRSLLHAAFTGQLTSRKKEIVSV